MKLIRSIINFLFPKFNLGEWIRFGDYYCIEHKVDNNTEYFLPGQGALLNFLQYFNTNFQNAWDLTKDGVVNTQDMLAALTGYGATPTPNPIVLPLDLFELNMEFGEGNFWFEPKASITFDDELVSFVWYHTTPYDDGVFTQANPNSFALDVVLNSGKIHTFTFIRKGYNFTA